VKKNITKLRHEIKRDQLEKKVEAKLTELEMKKIVEKIENRKKEDLQIDSNKKKSKKDNKMLEEDDPDADVEMVDVDEFQKIKMIETPKTKVVVVEERDFTTPELVVEKSELVESESSIED
jgi:hypothetical protein